MRKITSIFITVLFGINSLASPIDEKVRIKSAIEKSEDLVRSLPKDLNFQFVSILVSEIFRNEGIKLTNNSNQNFQRLANSGVFSRTEIEQAKKIIDISELSRMTLNDVENKSLDGVQVAVVGVQAFAFAFVTIVLTAAIVASAQVYLAQYEFKVECVKLVRYLNENNRDAYNKLCADTE